MIPIIVFIVTSVALALSFTVVFIPWLVTGFFSPLVFIMVFTIGNSILLYGVFERRSPLFGKIIWKSANNNAAVSLTFDDGPHEPYTSQILDILARYNVKATFFTIGENAAQYPETVKRIVKEGHEIGNHTYTHDVLPLKLPRYICDQIRRTSDLIEYITGVRPVLFRAPHGWRNPWMNKIVKEEGCIPVAWTLGVWDTDRPGADKIITRTLKGVENGCILLLHDGRGVESKADSSQLVEALPIIIHRITEMGYIFLTLSKLIEEAPKRCQTRR